MRPFFGNASFDTNISENISKKHSSYTVFEGGGLFSKKYKINRNGTYAKWG